MNVPIRSKLHRYGAISLTIILLFYLVSASARGWLSYTYASDPPPHGLKDAMILEEDNSDFYFLLGQYYDNYDFTAPRSEVSRYYRKALELNPLNYNYWFYLAEFLSREGDKNKALFALKQATNLSPGVVALRWGAGMLASKLGDQEALLDNLGAVIAYDQERRQKAFIVLWQSLRSGDRIADIIPDQAVVEYMAFLLDTKRVTEAYKIWSTRKSFTDYTRYMYMMNLLIYADEMELAKNAWIDRMGEWDGLVWNGGFEKEINNNGFDWTISDNPGIKITRVKNKNDDGHTVKIEFDGKQNYDFYHFRQVIPVEENTSYRFSSDLKTENITTLNGLFWEVYCLHEDGLYERSAETYGTTDWHRVEFSFKTPPGCSSVAIRLRRAPSDIADKLFSGTAWVDNASLVKEN